MKMIANAALAAFFMLGTTACSDKDDDTADTSSDESGLEDTASEETE